MPQGAEPLSKYVACPSFAPDGTKSLENGIEQLPFDVENLLQSSQSELGSTHIRQREFSSQPRLSKLIDPYRVGARVNDIAAGLGIEPAK